MKDHRSQSKFSPGKDFPDVHARESSGHLTRNLSQAEDRMFRKQIARFPSKELEVVMDYLGGSK